MHMQFIITKALTLKLFFTKRQILNFLKGNLYEKGKTHWEERLSSFVSIFWVLLATS
jgi:hypothetical protein